MDGGGRVSIARADSHRRRRPRGRARGRTKRTKLPFSPGDRWLLSAIGASAAVAIENITLRSSTPSPATDSTARRSNASRLAMRHSSASVALMVLQNTAVATCVHCGAGRSARRPCRGSVSGFRLDRRIGVGGMGVVYRAVDTNLQRYVAIKTLTAVSDIERQQAAARGPGDGGRGASQRRDDLCRGDVAPRAAADRRVLRAGDAARSAGAAESEPWPTRSPWARICPRGCTTCTASGCCIATSSRATSPLPPTVRPSCSISGWPRWWWPV